MCMETLKRASSDAALCFDEPTVTTRAADPAPATSVFVVDEVQRATGGPSPCFVYTGSLRSNDGCQEFCGDAPECTTPRGDREPKLTLYLAYEPPSPRIKRQCPEPAPPAPYRLSLSDADDSMLYTCRGLDQEVVVDERLQLAAWGGGMALAFPRAADLDTFAKLLSRVTVRAGSLAAHPAAALLQPQSAPRPVAAPADAAAATTPRLSQLRLPSSSETAASAGIQLATPGKVEERVSPAVARTPVPFLLGPALDTGDERRL